MKVQTKVSVLMIAVLVILTLLIAERQYESNQEVKLFLSSQIAGDKVIINKIPDFKSKGFLAATIDNAAWDEAVDFLNTNDTVWANENYRVSLINIENAYSLNETMLLFSVSDTGIGFDLVLMDLKMPVMDGLTATKLIKAKKPNLPVIAITAFARSGDKEKALEAGCDDYIPKPIKKSDLLALIHQHTGTPKKTI